MEVSHNKYDPGIEVDDKLQTSVLHSLIYFDIFNYPLTENEIARFCSVKLDDLRDVSIVLKGLTKKLMVFNYDEFYSLKNDISLIERRKKGNIEAVNILPKALKRSKLIQKFPFVRSVNISGSLSKNYFDENTDIDFFVITSPNRLWITRLLLTVYKKIFLFNSRKYFCINYYIDTLDMNIPDKNIFSATEVITLKNQTGEEFFKKFIEENGWVKNIYPNFYPSYTHLKEERSGFMKRTFEKLFSGKAGDKLDDAAFRITTKFLHKKYSETDGENFEINFRTKKHVSKHHPQGFQFRVLHAFEQKCHEFEKQHLIEL